MKLFEDFYQKACEKTRAVKSFSPVENEPPATINTTCLRQILEILFSTSLLVDEGRPVNFRGLFVEETNVESKIYELKSHYDYFEIKPSQEFSPKLIAKISQGLNFDRSLFVFSMFPSQVAPKIIGLLHLGSAIPNFHKHETGSAKTLPEAFIFSTLSPGNLGIAFGDQWLLALDKDEIISQELSLFSHSIFLGHFQPIITALEAKVSQIIQRPITDDERLQNFWAPYVRILDSICLQTTQKHHGGTLLIINESDSLSSLDIKHKISGPSLSYWQALETVITSRFRLLMPSIKEEEKPTWRYAMVSNQERLRDFCSLTSGQSQVDGAVVITNNLKNIGFGAEILSSTDNSAKLYLLAPDGNPGAEVDYSHFGTRHRSAIRYCFLNPNALAFIFSQDGGIKTVFTKEGKTLFGKNLNMLRYASYFGS